MTCELSDVMMLTTCMNVICTNKIIRMLLTIRKDVLHKRYKIFKEKNNKWSTMAGTFNTTFVTEIILKLPELNHSAEIYEKRHLKIKLLNNDLILGRDILHKLGS